MARRKAKLLPYQIRWIDDEANCLGEKSRRTGWTWAEAYDAVRRRFKMTQPRNLDYWFSSADESAGYEFIDYCRFFSRDLFGKVADYFTEQVEAPELRKGFTTAFVIRCPNAKRITAMTSNPRRFRSKGGDVRVDEFGFHDDAEGMHDAAAPCTQWGGNYKTWSTHNGEGSLFNQFVKNCRKIYAHLGHDPDHPPIVPFSELAAAALKLGVTPVFSYHRVTIHDAIEQGIVEKINETRGTRQTDEAFLQEIRLKTRSLDAYNQEYLCIASADAFAWLPYNLIESCESDLVPQPVWIDPANRFIPPAKTYTGGPVYVGVDVGRTKDLSYIVYCEQVGDVLWPRMILAMRNMPIPDQVDIIERVIKVNQFRMMRTCVDYTGVGIGLGDGLVRAFGPLLVENINQSNTNKAVEAVGLLTCMQDKKLRLPANNQRLRDGLHKVRKEVTLTGQPRFVAERDDDGHADEFWGFALAVHAGKAETVGEFRGRSGRARTFAKAGLY